MEGEFPGGCSARENCEVRVRRSVFLSKPGSLGLLSSLSGCAIDRQKNRPLNPNHCPVQAPNRAFGKKWGKNGERLHRNEKMAEKLTHFKNEKSAQRGSFRAGYPADIRGSFARISRPKTSVRSLKILEKQAFGRGYP